MTLPAQLEPFDMRITSWMARHGVTITRLARGIVFVWFVLLHEGEAAAVHPELG